MSYEGYEVILCEDGHINNINSLSYWDIEDLKNYKCCCGKHLDTNIIGYLDETNCLPYYLDFKLILLKKEKYETCMECGHKKLVSYAKYRIEKCETYKSETGEILIEKENEND